MERWISPGAGTCGTAGVYAIDPSGGIGIPLAGGCRAPSADRIPQGVRSRYPLFRARPDGPARKTCLQGRRTRACLPFRPFRSVRLRESRLPPVKGFFRRADHGTPIRAKIPALPALRGGIHFYGRHPERKGKHWPGDKSRVTKRCRLYSRRFHRIGGS